MVPQSFVKEEASGRTHQDGTHFSGIGLVARGQEGVRGQVGGGGFVGWRILESLNLRSMPTKTGGNSCGNGREDNGEGQVWGLATGGRRRGFGA